MLVEMFDKPCDSGKYKVTYPVREQIVKNAGILGTLSTLNNSIYEHFYMHIKQPNKRTTKTKRIMIMEVVSVMERNYERTLTWQKKGEDGKFGRSDVSIARNERSWQYVVCDEMEFTTHEII